MPKTRTSKSSPLALQLLKEDHQKVEKAFKEFEKMDREADPETCRQIVLSTCEDLKVHTTLEEEIFYPALRDKIEDEDLLNEAGVEHETAKMLIEQLENMSADDPNYYATFTVLGEYVMHHVKEEEGEIFPAAKKAEIDLEDIGERMRARKEELLGQMEKEEEEAE